jgi:hypothetical protein
MDIRTLCLLILRAIALSGLAVSLILLSFAQQLLEGHGISIRDQSFTSGLLLGLALLLPIALWFLSPLVVKRLSLRVTKRESMIDLHDILPLVFVITAISTISRGLVELSVAILSRLTLDAAPSAVLVVNLDQSPSFGLSGVTQIAFGALLLWLTPLLSGNLVRLLARRLQ